MYDNPLLKNHCLNFNQTMVILVIQICTNKGAHPHPKGDTFNSKIVKIHHNLKNSRIRTVPISTKASLDEGD